MSKFFYLFVISIVLPMSSCRSVNHSEEAQLAGQGALEPVLGFRKLSCTDNRKTKFMINMFNKVGAWASDKDGNWVAVTCVESASASATPASVSDEDENRVNKGRDSLGICADKSKSIQVEIVNERLEYGEVKKAIHKIGKAKGYLIGCKEW